MIQDPLQDLVGDPIKVVWLDHYGVKQNWDEEFDPEPARITSFGYLTKLLPNTLVITPHYAHGDEGHTCGDMVIVRAAIEEVFAINTTPLPK